MWYVYTKEYYSAIKKNEIMPLAATWIDLEIILLSKQARERQMPYDITSMWNPMTQVNLFTKQKQAHRHRKQTYGYQREKGVGEG